MPLVKCPSCRRDLNLPESLLGKQVKCSGCGQLLMVPAPRPAPIPVADLIDVIPDSGPAAPAPAGRRPTPAPRPAPVTPPAPPDNPWAFDDPAGPNPGPVDPDAFKVGGSPRARSREMQVSAVVKAAADAMYTNLAFNGLLAVVVGIALLALVAESPVLLVVILLGLAAWIAALVVMAIGAVCLKNLKKRWLVRLAGVASILVGVGCILLPVLLFVLVAMAETSAAASATALAARGHGGVRYVRVGRGGGGGLAILLMLVLVGLIGSGVYSLITGIRFLLTLGKEEVQRAWKD